LHFGRGESITIYSIVIIAMYCVAITTDWTIITLHETNSFAEVSKNLATYKSDNNFRSLK